jgi:hypothetical protein
MARIYLCGHGSYTPGDGWATVPAQSTITFYTPHQKLLKGGDDYRIIQGAFDTPDSVIRAFHTCPNLRLYPDDPTVIAHSESIRQPGTTLYWSANGNGELLTDIFQKHAGSDFIWAACRHVSFKNPGAGEQLGVNLVDERDGTYSKYDYVARQYLTVTPRT